MFGNIPEKLNFFVIDSNNSPLMGLESSVKLKLVNREMKHLIYVNVIKNTHDIIKQYSGDFMGNLGKLPIMYNIKLREGASAKNSSS